MGAEVEPDFITRMNRFSDDIFDRMNCIKIGKINKFTKTNQTAEIEIMLKYKISTTELIDYPILVDCPVFFLQGGGAYVDVPITAGDYCIVLFSDKDIDKWFEDGNKHEPMTTRKHDLSDGIALVGINPSSNPLDISGTKFRLQCNNKEFEINNASKITMLQGTESFVKGDTLYTQLNTILLALQTFSSGLNVTTLAGQASTLNTAMGTAIGVLSNIKSTLIKGK